MTDGPPAEAASRHEEAVELRKEAYTMALYVAICLLAALLAVPEDAAHTRVTGIIWGVTVGLAAAHWFAFRMSARLVGAGTIRSPDVRLASAQLLGAAVVAVLASVPVFLLPQSMELGTELTPQIDAAADEALLKVLEKLAALGVRAVERSECARPMPCV